MPGIRKRDRILGLLRPGSRKGKEKDVASQASKAVSKASSLAEATEPKEMPERLEKDETKEEVSTQGEMEEVPKQEVTEGEASKQEETGEASKKEETERSKKETTEDSTKKYLTTEDLWLRANMIVCERIPDLMAGYSQVLSDTENVNTLATSQSAQVVIDQLNKSRQDKQWKLSLLGKDVKIRDQAEKLVKFLLWTDKIVKAAVAGQPYAALAWTAVSVVLELVDTSSGTHADTMAGFKTISHVQMYWKICENKYLQQMQNLPDADEFIKALTDLYASILEYQARAICHMSKRQLVRSWENATGSTDWAGMAQAVDTQSSQCKAYMEETQKSVIDTSWSEQLKHMKKARDILDDIRSLMKSHSEFLENQYNDERDTSLFQDLFSFYENDKNANPGIVPNTCGWFLHNEQFRQWRNSDDRGLLWVSAGPGCGKSVLMRHLIDAGLLSNRITTSIVCYFFFKDGIDNRSNADNALAAILHQLFVQDSTGELIQLAYKKHKEQGKSLTRNFESLWEIFESCVRELDPAAELICVLDALDECETKSLNDLLGKLKTFYMGRYQTKRVKFLVTSRPFDFIDVLFKTFHNQSFYGHTDADNHIDAISDEINIVIDFRLHEILGINDSKYRGLAEHMKSTDSRTYLWVHLALEFIQQDRIMFRRDPNYKEHLDYLPLDLDEQYERLLNRGQVRAWGKQMLELLLQIMLVAVRPLTLDEANSALTFALEGEPGFPSYSALEEKRESPEQFRSDINSLCGHFVSIHDSKLYFIHQTAREFLTSADKSEKLQWKGHFNVQEAQEKFSLICMRFLHLLEPSMISYVEESRTYFGTYFFKYATEHWIDYVSFQEKEGDEVLRQARILCRTDEDSEKNFLHMDRYPRFRKLWKIHHERCNTPEYAKRTNLDVCLAIYLRLPEVAKYIIEYDQVDMSQGDHLLYAILADNMDMINGLLDLTDQVQVTEREMIAVAATLFPVKILTLFQEKRPGLTQIPESVLLKVISTSVYRYGFTVIDFVVALCSEKRDLEEKEQIYWFDWFGPRLPDEKITFNEQARKLFNLQDGRIQITNAIVKAAASNPGASPTLLLFLIDKYGDEINITDEVIVTMLSEFYPRRKGYNDLMLFLRDYANKSGNIQHIVEAAAARIQLRTMDAIQDAYGGSIQMTGTLILAALSNRYCCEIMIGMVACRDDISITDKVLEVVVTKFNGRYILRDLLKSGQCKVTLFLVEAVLKNASNFDKIDFLPLLFEYCDREDTIDKAIIQAVESLDKYIRIITVKKINTLSGGPEAIKKFATGDWSDRLEKRRR